MYFFILFFSLTEYSLLLFFFTDQSVYDYEFSSKHCFKCIP